MISNSGSYTGNGTTQNVTAPGAAAGLVLIKVAGSIAAMWCSAMPAASYKAATGSTALVTTNGITQHASGFTVGSDATINANGLTYDYVCVCDNADGNFSAISYTGNATDNRDLTLTGLSGTPDAAWVLGDTAQPVARRTSTMSGDQSGTYTTSLTTNLIQAFGSGTIQVGTSAIVNGNGITYYAVALKAVVGLFAVVTYTGDGTDNRDITGVGFSPDNIITKSASTDEPPFYPKRFTTDTCHHLTASADASDRIQARVSDGFTVGANVRVNANGVAYHATAWKDGTTAPPTSTNRLLSLGVG